MCAGAPYAEPAYGYPEASQTVVNVTNGKLIRLLVDDEPLDVRYGRLLEHERVLDLRAGTMTRHAEWESPAGGRVRVRSRRLVSFTQRAVAAIEYVVEPVDERLRLIAESELVANEPSPPRSGDPRVAAMLENPLAALDQDLHTRGAVLLHRTQRSGLRMAAGMDHLVEAPGEVRVETAATPDWARTTFVCTLERGQRLRIVKLLAYGWSALRSTSALRDQVAAALAGARHTGLEELLAEQRAYPDEFWDGADVRVEGDPPCSRRSGSRCSTSSRPAPGGSAAACPPRG